jgi:endo-1,4-beta-xylanase
MNLKTFSFPVGFAIKQSLLTRPEYTAKFDSDAETLTPENEMKFGVVHGDSESVYDFTAADQIVAFAKARGLRIHGHTLIWAKDANIPAWVKAFENTPNAVTKITQIIQNHITTVVNHFKTDVHSWDVVNEALKDDGTFQDCLWYRVLGEDYFRIAFQAAAAADPDCTLFYNDYNQQFESMGRFNKTVALKATLAAAGVPFHGVGFQMHVGLEVDIDLLREKLKMYADADFKVAISELDIRTEADGPDYTEEMARKLAEAYWGIFRAYDKAIVDQDKKWGITMWSVSDRDNYYNVGGLVQYPMLFDYSYQPKEAYYKVLSLLEQPVSSPLIFQDFELGNDDTVIGDLTSGTTPKIWTLEGPNQAAKIQIDETGLSASQTTQNTFNFPILQAGISDYVLETETGYVTRDIYTSRVMYMVFRYLGQNDLLAVQAENAGANSKWRLMKRSGSTETELFKTSIKPASGQIIKVMCNGSKISLYIDGIFQCTVTETQYQTETKIGYKMRGFDDKFSSWKFIKVSPLPVVFDEFAAGARGNINGLTTNGGTSTKTWAVASTGSGNDGMEVTAVGLEAIAGTSDRYNLATVNSGLSNFTLTAKLLRTKLDYTTPGCAMLIFRASTVKDFFTVRVNDSTTNRKWLLVRRLDDNNSTLLTSPFDAKDGDVVKVVANGSTIDVYINDYHMGTATDSNLLAQTKVGFRGRGEVDDYSAWGNIQVDTL